jgi:hypothetical protein
MFEGADEEFLNQQRNLEILKKSCTIILHRCKRCKKLINTNWEDNEIVGEFIADDADFSEVLGIVVANPKGIVCHRCYYGY